MPPDEYCSQLRKAVWRFENYGITESIEFQEEMRPGKQIVIGIRILLTDRSELVIREYVDAKYKIEKLRYAYQHHTQSGELIFRYDNADHKPSLGFKRHKHLPDGEIVHAPPLIFLNFWMRFSATYNWRSEERYL